MGLSLVKLLVRDSTSSNANGCLFPIHPTAFLAVFRELLAGMRAVRGAASQWSPSPSWAHPETGVVHMIHPAGWGGWQFQVTRRSRRALDDVLHFGCAKQRALADPHSLWRVIRISRNVLPVGKRCWPGICAGCSVGVEACTHVCQCPTSVCCTPKASCALCGHATLVRLFRQTL